MFWWQQVSNHWKNICCLFRFISLWILIHCRLCWKYFCRCTVHCFAYIFPPQSCWYHRPISQNLWADGEQLDRGKRRREQSSSRGGRTQSAEGLLCLHPQWPSERNLRHCEFCTLTFFFIAVLWFFFTHVILSIVFHSLITRRYHDAIDRYLQLCPYYLLVPFAKYSNCQKTCLLTCH